MEEKHARLGLAKRLNIHIPGYLHKEIRLVAAQKDISITQFIIRAILEQLSRSKSN